MGSCCAKAGFGVFKFLCPYLRWLLIGCAVLDVLLSDTFWVSGGPCISLPFPIITSRWCRGQVNDGHPYTRLSETSNSNSRGWRGGSQQQRYCVRSFGLRGLLDTQRGLDALPVLLYSLLIVAEPGAMAQTSLRGSATGLSCGSRNGIFVDRFNCPVYVYSLLSEWLVRTVSFRPGNTCPERMVYSYRAPAGAQ